MHDDVGLVGVKDAIQSRAVANIGLLEGIQRVVCYGCHIGEARGICQRIEVYNRMAAGHRQPHHG